MYWTTALLSAAALQVAYAIVNGTELKALGPFSSLASVYITDHEFGYYNAFRCGAVVIDADYVLTTASCCDDYFPVQFRVVAGTVYRATAAEASPSAYNITTVHKHPDFNASTQDFDYCLLELKETISDPSVRPALLPTLAPLLPIDAEVVGWGYTHLTAGAKQPVEAREGAVDLHFETLTDSLGRGSRPSCAKAYEGIRKITPQMNCDWQLSDNGVSACRLDLGSPVYDSSGETVYGLSIFGTWTSKKPLRAGVAQCTSDPLPNINADVSAAKSWIRQTTGKLL